MFSCGDNKKIGNEHLPFSQSCHCINAIMESVGISGKVQFYKGHLKNKNSGLNILEKVNKIFTREKLTQLM